MELKSTFLKSIESSTTTTTARATGSSRGVEPTVDCVWWTETISTVVVDE
jgi:hypothetical protein